MGDFANGKIWLRSPLMDADLEKVGGLNRATEMVQQMQAEMVDVQTMLGTNPFRSSTDISEFLDRRHAYSGLRRGHLYSRGIDPTFRQQTPQVWWGFDTLVTDRDFDSSSDYNTDGSPMIRFNRLSKSSSPATCTYNTAYDSGFPPKLIIAHTMLKDSTEVPDNSWSANVFCYVLRDTITETSFDVEIWAPDSFGTNQTFQSQFPTGSVYIVFCAIGGRRTV